MYVSKSKLESFCYVFNSYAVVSKKVELLKQVNELSAIKNDLALEVRK